MYVGKLSPIMVMLVALMMLIFSLLLSSAQADYVPVDLAAIDGYNHDGLGDGAGGKSEGLDNGNLFIDGNTFPVEGGKLFDCEGCDIQWLLAPWEDDDDEALSIVTPNDGHIIELGDFTGNYSNVHMAMMAGQGTFTDESKMMEFVYTDGSSDEVAVVDGDNPIQDWWNAPANHKVVLDVKRSDGDSPGGGIVFDHHIYPCSSPKTLDQIVMPEDPPFGVMPQVVILSITMEGNQTGNAVMSVNKLATTWSKIKSAQ